MSTRKRRAPGASPPIQQSSDISNNMYPQNTSNLSPDQYMSNWNDQLAAAANPTFGDASMFDGMNFTGNTGGGGQSMHNRVVSVDSMEDGSYAGAGPTGASNPGQLVRRNPNQQLAARGPTSWEPFNSTPVPPEEWENENEDEELEQKALIAKKEAQAKRKQIPPFVQKLSSFLDRKENTNLIRWSDDGNSFIVLDEDEFARTLIPELFKHNNYASFVRQLNMYGFHKKVGLSDNSMKASETKAKAPSEYSNKYFKRGRPELLWLIQKPKNPGSNAKRKRDDDGRGGDSDDDRKYVPDAGGGGGGGGEYGEDRLAVRANQDMTMIPRTEYNNLRSEVRALQQQQKVISTVLNQIRRQNDQLYQQATAFQTLHDRHENSINAILTFLATFYNRSLETNQGLGSFAEMFAPQMAQQQSHGSVVDVGDFPEKVFQQSPQASRPSRRPLALLPAPVAKADATLSPMERTATLSPSVRSATSPATKPASRASALRSPAPPSNPPSQPPVAFASQPARDEALAAPLKVDAASPPQPYSALPQDDIMSVIQNANANQSTRQSPHDFSAALSNFETQGGNVPLTQQQRNDVLSLMANNTSAASPNSNIVQNTNNALVNPEPPAMPSLDQFTATQAQLDLLQKMSEEQNSRVQTLQSRLQPLSPSGSIPGLDTSYFANSNLGEPGTYDLDLDSFVQGDDYFPQEAANGPSPSAPGDFKLPDLNYELPDAPDLNGAGFFEGTGPGGFDGANDDGLRVDANGDGEGGRVESVNTSSAGTSPSVVTVEDVEDEGEGRRTSKRSRRK